MGTRGKRFVAGVMVLFLSFSLTGCRVMVKTAIRAAQKEEEVVLKGNDAVPRFPLEEFKSGDGAESTQTSDAWKLDQKEAKEAEETETTEMEEKTETAEKTVGGDPILWFNATCAILMEINVSGADYTLFGGVPPTDENIASAQIILEESWNVTDRESAMSTMEWILTAGHRAYFLEDMQSFHEGGVGDVKADERADYLREYTNMPEKDVEPIATCYTAYWDEGRTIDAWDYSRAMSLYGWYYLAGYYTKEEALDGALALAEQIQSSFTSWDDFTESYLLGYLYWAKESSDERRAIYEEIKAMPDSVYNVDWNMLLEKSW